MAAEQRIVGDWLAAACVQFHQGRPQLVLMGATGGRALVADLDEPTAGGITIRQALIDALLAGCRREAQPITVQLDVSGLRLQGIHHSTSRVVRDENGDMVLTETEGANYSTIEAAG